MKREYSRYLTAFLCSICLVCSQTACAGQSGSGPEEPLSRAQAPSQEETTHPPAGLKENDSAATEEHGQPIQTEASETNILIAYFTWADNTEVKDTDAAIDAALSHYESVGDRENYDGVDAATSASVLVPGNTAQMADWIQERTGGDLFSIVASEAYSSIYDECLDRAADEKAENARPGLQSHVEHMEQYDTIFLGFPNWWSSAPMAVLSFLEEYDLSGKTIVPFCAHGTGGIAGSVRDITAVLPDSVEILEPLGVYRPDIDSAQPAVNDWLDSLGYTQDREGKTEEPEDDSIQDNGSRQVAAVVDGQECVLTLGNGVTADSLYHMLPLELSFEDFNGTEKISYTPQPLTVDESEGGHAPSVGDLCVYAPWGNLCIFYQEFQYSDDLIYLGHVDTGMEKIAGMEDDFQAALETLE